MFKLMKTIVFFRTLGRVFRVLATLKITATLRFHRPVQVKEVAVLRIVFLVVLSTIYSVITSMAVTNKTRNPCAHHGL